jgi:hypothetical protein
MIIAGVDNAPLHLLSGLVALPDGLAIVVLHA